MNVAILVAIERGKQIQIVDDISCMKGYVIKNDNIHKNEAKESRRTNVEW